MQAKLSTKRMKHSPTQGSQTRERGEKKEEGSARQSHVQQTIECEKSRISCPLLLSHSAGSFVQATENKVYDFDCRRRRSLRCHRNLSLRSRRRRRLLLSILHCCCCRSNRTKLNDPVALPFTATRNHSQRSALPEFI